jgi:hypothetical protein
MPRDRSDPGFLEFPFDLEDVHGGLGVMVPDMPPLPPGQQGTDILVGGVCIAIGAALLGPYFLAGRFLPVF